MKKFYTIMLAVLLGSIAAQAQEADYQPLVREGVRWVNHSQFVYSGDEVYFGPVNTYTITLRGDTTLTSSSGTHQYKRVIHSMYPWRNIFMRESEKKVYVLASDDPMYSSDEEYLLYDFSDDNEAKLYSPEGDETTYVREGSVDINGHNCRVYKGDFGWLVESVGLVSRCDGDMIFPRWARVVGGEDNYGLDHLEDMGGNIIYKAPWYEEPTTCMPLVREGVVWHWSWDEVDDQLDKDAYLYFNHRLYDFKIEFRGDTVISGITYKKCYMYSSDSLETTRAHRVAYGREANGKVMFTTNEDFRFLTYTESSFIPGDYYDLTGEIVVYDFSNIEEFARLQCGSDRFIQSVDTIQVGDNWVRRYTICDSSAYPETFHYVESVGIDRERSISLFEPFLDLPTGNVSHWDGLIMLTDLDGNILYKGHNYDRFCYEQIGCQPLVREDRTWVNLYTYTDLENNKEIEFSYKLFFKGDTIIDGMTYKKCFRVALDPEKASQCPAFFSDLEPIAALREFDGQVYARYFKEEPDFDRTIISEAHRLYDFYYYLYPNAWDSVEVDGQLCYVVQDKDFGTVISSIGVDNGMSGDLLYPQYSVLPGMQYDDIHFLYTLNGEGKIIYLSNYYEEYRASHQSDLNGDGVVDIADINILINVMLGYDVPTGHQGHDTIPVETAEKIMDMTGDGHVDITDINVLINRMLGK